MRLYLLIFSLILTSCATVAPPSNPEINAQIKDDILNKPVPSGYARFIICGGGLYTITYFGKSKSTINRNGMYEISYQNEVIAKFNQNEVVVLDSKIDISKEFIKPKVLEVSSPNYKNIKTTIGLLTDADRPIKVIEISRLADARDFQCVPGMPCEIRWQLISEPNPDVNYCKDKPIVGYKLIP